MNIYTEDFSARMNSTADSSAKVRSQASTAATGPPLPSVNNPMYGRPLLAQAIAETPDLQIFPSFTDLNIKSLLYYQAELVAIRQDLHKEECKDVFQPSSQLTPCYSNDLRALIYDRDKSIKDKTGNTPLPRQWELIEQLRTTLEKYSKLMSHICRSQS